MKLLLRSLPLLIGLLLVSSCLPAPGVTPTPPPAHTPASQPTTSPLPTASPLPSATPMPDSSPLPTLSPLSRPCEAVMREETTAYTTPGGDIFGTSPAGYRVQVEARTEDGWIGFEPGVAHAAAVGPFRLVWVRAEDIRLEGDCADVPLMTPPPPGYCYEMAMWDIPLRAEPQEEADIVATLPAGDYAVILGTSPEGHWYRLQLHDGTEGWMAEEALNITGACEALPTLQP